jgi:prepilin-type N-terminal cleavage/methylation domain-containing protein
MKKKGFTLVELLAVIAILAILVIIALPNVLGMFNEAKKNTFVTELQSIYTTAETQFVSDSMGDMTQFTDGIKYGRAGTVDLTGAGFKLLDLSGTKAIDYYIHFNLAGKVVEFYARDGQFQYVYSGKTGLAKEKITKTTIKDTKAFDGVMGTGSCANATNALANTPTLGTPSNTEINTGVITVADADSYCTTANYAKLTGLTNSTATFE